MWDTATEYEQNNKKTARVAWRLILLSVDKSSIEHRASSIEQSKHSQVILSVTFLCLTINGVIRLNDRRLYIGPLATHSKARGSPTTLTSPEELRPLNIFSYFFIIF